MIRIPNIFFVQVTLLFLVLNSCKEGKTKSNEINTNFTAEQIYDKNVNNTVTIITDRGQGSGFFIESNKVITNYHVVEGSINAVIFLNNSQNKYKVNGYLAVDQTNDLILLEVDYINNGFIEIENNIPKPGLKIFAIGSPVGLSKTLSDGIISGMRDFNERKLLQITAPISHGSSGCPILNEKNKLVGVAVGGVSDATNIGFCIPANYVNTLIAFKNDYSTDLNTLITVKAHKITKQPSESNLKNHPNSNKPIVSTEETLDKLFLKDFELRISGIDNSISTNGKVYIKKENGLYYLNGFQTDKENFRSASIEGTIRIINKKQFIFNGTIHLKNPKYSNNCSDCTIETIIPFDWFDVGNGCWSSCEGKGSSSELLGCIFIGSD